MQSIEIEKSCPKEAIIIALQKYLKDFWIRISESKHHFRITFEQKAERNTNFDDALFLNELVESEFIYHKSKETMSLREAIIKKALSPYKGDIE
jgi:His-Xaa-Ser system protein HxsD